VTNTVNNANNVTGPAGNSVAGQPVPRVSVCVPTYNGVAYLKECLLSIQQQTLADFEIIIVDDESSDGSFELALDFAQRDPRIRVYRNTKRLGLVGNWGRCLELARADWIKFAFQDDILLPACLEKLLAACQREHKLFGFCARDFLFEDGVGQTLRQWFEKHAKRLQQDYRGTGVIEPAQAAKIAVHEPSHNPVGEPTVTLIHKSVFQKLHGFDEALIQLCDAEFWDRVLVNYGAVFVPEELATFRIHARATTALNHEKRAFRMGMLDLLVLQYRFAFAASFQALRQLPQTGKSVFALRTECAFTAARAWREARQKERAGDNSFMVEWKAVKAHCPGLQALAWLGCMLEIPGRLKRALAGKKVDHQPNQIM